MILEKTMIDVLLSLFQIKWSCVDFAYPEFQVPLSALEKKVFPPDIIVDTVFGLAKPPAYAVKSKL